MLHHALRARREPEGSDAAETGETRIEAAVLRPGRRAVQVRVLGTGEPMTVRASDLWHVMPGHVVTLALTARWPYRGRLFADGRVEAVRIDVPALRLPQLQLTERGPIDVAGEAVRTGYEMEEILPWTRRGSDCDPILVALARKKRGDPKGAARLLMDLLEEDLRCLDAHAHLGNLVFPAYPEHALIHYEIGAAIGEHALGPDFAGALPWSRFGNRPFLRCLHGQGLALWRLDRPEEAARAFERLLWLNPDDEQGAGRLLAEVKAGRPWAEERH